MSANDFEGGERSDARSDASRGEGGALAEASEAPAKVRGNGKPPRGAKKPRASAAVVERRVNAIFGLVIAGLQPIDIRRAVAEQQINERRKREKAFKLAQGQGAANPEREALLDVPFTWGDEEIPLRTFERYLQQARAQLDARAPEFAKQRQRMLAIAEQRINAIYGRALADKRWYAALKAIELSIETFGLRDQAKLDQMRADAMDRAGANEDEDGGSLALPIEPEDRARSFANLAAAAIAANPALRGQLSALIGEGSAGNKVMP